MQVQSKMLAFADFSHILAQADVPTNPSEVHGILCGLVCIGHKLDGKFWFDAVLSTLGAKSLVYNRELIIDLYDATCRQLSGLEYDFQLLLPDETHSFAERALALSRWCKGFSYGLEIADAAFPERVSEEVQDAVRCIGEVGKLDFSDIEVSDTDKSAYQSVVDFVRTSVIMMYAELMELPIGNFAEMSPDLIALH